MDVGFPMSGAGDDKVSVTSWGTALVDQATWQVWKVRHHGKVVAMITLPPRITTIEALIIANTLLEAPVDL